MNTVKNKEKSILKQTKFPNYLW